MIQQTTTHCSFGGGGKAGEGEKNCACALNGAARTKTAKADAYASWPDMAKMPDHLRNLRPFADDKLLFLKGDSIMEENKKIEMNDEELEKVVGGFKIGDHVVANSRTIRYCPGCGKLAMYSYGTVVGITWYERDQLYFLDIKTDCCGHVERRADFACELY